MTEDMFGEDTTLDPDKALEAVGGDADFKRWEGNVGLLLAATVWTLKQRLDETLAEQLAPEVVMSNIDALGGHICYWPKAEDVKRGLRDAQIGVDYLDKGLGMDALVDKYKLTMQRLYAIIARQKEARRRASPDLFGFARKGGKG